MSCFHPMLAVSTGLNSNGKRDIKFVAGPTEWESYPPNARLKIPCGRCVGCRLERSRQWANRCMLELQYHESSYFVTLTYDDEHVPVTYYSENVDGEARSGLTLRARDLQLFLKRLRKEHFYERLRFFACGEYGTTTYRPHYHAIIFGLTLDDLRPYKRSPQNYDYFISDSLTECWGLGFVVVGAVTWETCAYTARYIMKKALGQGAEVYERFNIEPEFVRMSRKPGIAYQYYADHPDLYQYEYINLPTDKGQLKFRPPRYYDRLFDVDNPDQMAKIKAKRLHFALVDAHNKSLQTSLIEPDRLAVEEAALTARIKSLERKL